MKELEKLDEVIILWSTKKIAKPLRCERWEARLFISLCPLKSMYMQAFVNGYMPSLIFFIASDCQLTHPFRNRMQEIQRAAFTATWNPFSHYWRKSSSSFVKLLLNLSRAHTHTPYTIHRRATFEQVAQNFFAFSHYINFVMRNLGINQF